MNNKQGFTLVELLLVVGIIVILAAAVFVALDPLSRLQDSRNAERWSEVNSIMDAVQLYVIDVGAIPTGVGTTREQLGTAATGCDDCDSSDASCLDLSTALVDQGYLASIPEDPYSGSSSETRYWIERAATGIITVGSCDEEASATIQVSR